MSVEVDVIYQDGEVTAFCRGGTDQAAELKLDADKPNAVTFRFCRVNGEPEFILQMEDFSHAQVLLSHRDRMLAAAEENIVFTQGADNFQTLAIKDFCINTAETAAVLRDSLWDVEPKRRNSAAGELSVAIYSQTQEYALQLFFTLPVVIQGAFLAL